MSQSNRLCTRRDTWECRWRRTLLARKRRKVDTANRTFKNEWANHYMFILLTDSTEPSHMSYVTLWRLWSKVGMLSVTVRPNTGPLRKSIHISIWGESEQNYQAESTACSKLCWHFLSILLRRNVVLFSFILQCRPPVCCAIIILYYIYSFSYLVSIPLPSCVVC